MSSCPLPSPSPPSISCSYYTLHILFSFLPKKISSTHLRISLHCIIYLPEEKPPVIFANCVILLSLSLDLFIVGWIFHHKFSMRTISQSHANPFLVIFYSVTIRACLRNFGAPEWLFIGSQVHLRLACFY